MKTGLVASRLFFASFISLLLFGSVIWKLPERAIAQSAIPDDVKHDTPGQSVKPGQSVHIDVNLALVNVTVTDHMIAWLQALSRITSASSKTTSSRNS